MGWLLESTFCFLQDVALPLVFLSLRPVILHDEAVNSMKSWWKKVQDQNQPSGQLRCGICMEVGISHRCIKSYQDEGFAGNPYETAYRKMYRRLCSLLAGQGPEEPFGGDKAEVDSKPMVVLSRLAQLIASWEKRALTCLVKGDFRQCKAPRYSILTLKSIL